MSVKGVPMRKREIPCTMCGTTVLRAAHFSNAKCPPCQRKHATATYGVYLKTVRQEARRYRILMALSPYGTWDQLLAAIRVRQPRTRAQRYDLAIERRTQ